MDLLNIFIRLVAKDEASPEVEKVSQGLTGKLASAALTAGKALAAAFVTKKVVEFGKAAFDSYKDYEQLWGGVQKLYGNANQSLDEYAKSVGKTSSEVRGEYERNAKAEATMARNAQQAWKTAGMSVNSYMETATQFSAALINSIGGDTQKAAELTDTAMRAMSDNFNTFGRDVSGVFSALSRGQFQTLENLNLGYTGTKEGMQKLIDDANEYAKSMGQAGDLTIDSFADIVTAIDLVQQKQGIAGTTAKEALGTIEGSMNATKAAWENLLLSIGQGGENTKAAVADLMTALTGEGGEGGLIRNVTDEIKVVIEGMIDAMPELLGAIIDAVVELGPELLELVGTLLADLWARFTEWFASVDWAGLWNDAKKAAGEALNAIIKYVVENGPKMLETAKQFFIKIRDGIVAKWPEIQQAIGDVVKGVLDWIIQNGPTMLSTALQWIGNILTAIIQKAPEILAEIGRMLSDAITAILNKVGEMLQAGLSFVGGMLDGAKQKGSEVTQWFSGLPGEVLTAMGDLGSYLWSAGVNLMSGFIGGIESMASSLWSAASSVVSNAINGAKSRLGIKSPSKVFHQIGVYSVEGYIDAWEDESKHLSDAVSDALGNAADIGDELNIKGSFGIDAAGSKSVRSVNISIDHMEVREEQDLYSLSYNLNELINRQEDATLWTV